MNPHDVDVSGSPLKYPGSLGPGPRPAWCSRDLCIICCDVIQCYMLCNQPCLNNLCYTIIAKSW